MTDRFNVAIFDAEGYWHYSLRDVDAKTAVEKAAVWSAIGETTGYPTKVAITDQDDFTNFLWEMGRGILYPPLGEVPPSSTNAPRKR